MKYIATLAALAFFAAASALMAQQTTRSPVIVELFTSQGCSSCPPADALLHELAERDDVIAIALHVDYWDYIGWKDEFADPRHAQRQRGYAIEAGRRSVYTPQMIVNGTTDIVGAKPMQLAKAITDHALQPSPVTLDVTRNEAGITIAATADEVQGPLVVQMLYYTPKRTARISRGENAGHTLDYANVAEGWKVLREWDGATKLTLAAEVEPDKPVVVLVQQGMHGPILAGAQLR